jgi:hypothetical protein
MYEEEENKSVEIPETPVRPVLRLQVDDIEEPE